MEHTQNGLNEPLEWDKGKSFTIFSPFSLYLNDFEEVLLSNIVRGLSCLPEKVEKELDIYLQLFVLLYADDTILISESPDDFQYILDIFSTYCKGCHLKVNSKKPKTIYFVEVQMIDIFSLEGSQLDKVNNVNILELHLVKWTLLIQILKNCMTKQLKLCMVLLVNVGNIIYRLIVN